MSDSLGPVESLPGYMERLEDNEESAWDLQGMIFSDGDLDGALSQDGERTTAQI